MVWMLVKKAFSGTWRRTAKLLQRHPLRPMREMVDIAFEQTEQVSLPRCSGVTLNRRAIPPEKLLRALLLQILYSIRSERMLCEQLDYNRQSSPVYWFARWTIRCAITRLFPRIGVDAHWSRDTGALPDCLMRIGGPE